MGHTCPKCGINCFCGGDIDDLIFDDTDYAWKCHHCPDEDGDDYYEDHWMEDK